MSLKDFVALALKVSGFWMVINLVIGIGQGSMLYTGDFLDQLEGREALFLLQIILPLIIGVLLILMPYKVANFVVTDSIDIQGVEKLCRVFTRVGIALLGIYIVVTGIQAFVYNFVLYLDLAPEYSRLDDFRPKRNHVLIS